MRINGGTLRAAAAPALLLAAAAAGAGPAQAAGPDFQYLGTDDQVHVLHSPTGCRDVSGAGSGGVVNKTRSTAVLYSGAGCSGVALATVPAGKSAPTSYGYGSVEFAVTR